MGEIKAYYVNTSKYYYFTETTLIYFLFFACWRCEWFTITFHNNFKLVVAFYIEITLPIYFGNVDLNILRNA